MQAVQLNVEAPIDGRCMSKTLESGSKAIKVKIGEVLRAFYELARKRCA